MRRRWWVVALLLVLALPDAPPALGQGNVVDLLDGKVLIGQTGVTDDLELTEAELAAATRRVDGLTVGLVTRGPADIAPGDEATAAAATARLGSAGIVVDRCLVDDDRSAEDCMDQLFRDHALAIIVVGDLGDLVAASETPIRNRVLVIGVGATELAEGAVTLAVDPVTAGATQGTAAGKASGPTAARRQGNALVLAARDPERADPVREATEASLRKAARRVKVADRLGPLTIHTVEDLEATLDGQGPIRVALGEGLVLDDVDATALERLPKGLRLITWECSEPVIALLDLSSRLRGCVARAEDEAGEAAADVVLAIKTSRDVPAGIAVPVYVYRGTVPVGPGMVELGKRLKGTSPAPTAAERAAAAATLADRVVGLVLPVSPGSREPEAQRLIRTEMEAAVAALGATVQTCVSDGVEAAAQQCVEDLLNDGAAAIVPIATRANLAGPASAAVAAGVPVVGINEPRMGDTGAIYVLVNPQSVGRLSGRMAGAYAERIWKREPVEVVLFNDVGAGGQDKVAPSVERALVQSDPDARVMARLAARSDELAAKAVSTVLKRYPATRILVGRHAWRAAPILIKRKNVNRGLVIYAQECTPDVVAAIDAGVGTGGRIKGCVDRDPAGAGRLGGEVLTRLTGGATVPEVVEVQVVAYEP